MSRNYSNGELSLHQLETVATPLHTPDVMKIGPHDNQNLQSTGVVVVVVTIKCLRITAIYAYQDLYKYKLNHDYKSKSYVTTSLHPPTCYHVWTQY